ncbi:hypothetical protein EJB05_05780 [Eragrostis curvula]|uniref:Factor of DNA methylation 1-5/IDN2 domain-containing protein n=1 Tax=Eragrostis curvula TaxID=38414 RepID=A0A5J9WE88_9POAL|nr:hypothetical protein EJB05_05780 [Eragrostis curvula]
MNCPPQLTTPTSKTLFRPQFQSSDRGRAKRALLVLFRGRARVKMTEPKDDHLSHSIQEPALHVMYNPTEDISFLQNHFGVEVATKISDLFKSHIANTHSVLERENLKLLRRIGEIFKEIQRSQGETEHSSRRRKLDLQNTKEMKVAEKVGNRVDNSNTPDGMEADAALKDQVSNVAKVSQQNESITVHKDMALGDRKTENESTDVQNMDWNHITSESYTDLKEKINMITNDLIERDEEMEDLESLNKTLLIMERRTNNELSEARRELIEVLRKMKETQSIIGVKQVGQIDQEVFLNARRLKGRDDDLKDAAFFSSKWQEEISNSGWHPFKVTIVDGVAKEVIMEDDERIVALKEEWGTEVYNSVVQALIELNEYNPSGRHPVHELWNFSENRKASVAEAIKHLIKLCKKILEFMSAIDLMLDPVSGGKAAIITPWRK